ncbi:MAG: Holliday junction branch migration protein RuvA [Ignavibacteria bacterium]|nr:Holliday junction branch migration protein RuvA [Ignavibacteria bacterium]
MIRVLTGKLVSKSPAEVCLDVGGVGYLLNIPLSTFDQLPEPGAETILQTHLHVREDALQLFGFHTTDELGMFRLLISVSGIGPRLALGILSGTSVTSLRDNLTSGHIPALTAVPGIGKKLAERMVMELRDKTGTPTGGDSQQPDPLTNVRAEAVLALLSLGYSRPAAEKAVRSVQESNATAEDLVKAALRLSSR